jgi:ribonuclease BN (tRNA processing enzyme)
VHLTVIGCSPAWPNPGGAQSGYLLGVSGQRVLLDCGPGVLARLRGEEVWPDLDAVVITHFHLDHWGDLVPWVWGSLYLSGRGSNPRKPQLWLPPAGSSTLERFGSQLGFPDMFERVFSLHEYRPDQRFALGEMELTATRVPHYTVEAYALRVEAGGRVLAYSGDSGPDGALARVAAGAHLFVCESTLADSASDGEPRGHLSLEEAVAAFQAAAAERLLLTHRPIELDRPAGLDFAYDGLALEV